MKKNAAYYERRETFKAFAALVSIPAMFFGAAVFDGGAMGEIARGAIELVISPVDAAPVHTYELRVELGGQLYIADHDLSAR